MFLAATAATASKNAFLSSNVTLLSDVAIAEEVSMITVTVEQCQFNSTSISLPNFPAHPFV
jgi:hypothetical protein